MEKAVAATRAGFRRFFSSSALPSARAAPVSPPWEPSPNLFISGLNKRTTSEGLREAFSKFGNVVQARVVTDRVSGYSKGFGFVSYATTEEAAQGIKGMDGKFLDGWVIFAEYARPRPLSSEQQASQPTNAVQQYNSSQVLQSSSHHPSAQASEPLPIYSNLNTPGCPPSNYAIWQGSYHPSQASQPEFAHVNSEIPSSHDKTS